LTLRDGIQASAVTISPVTLARGFAIWVVFFMSVVGASPLAPAPSEVEDPRAFVGAVVANELAADASDHSLWMYRDDNKVPDAHTVKLVIETSQGDLSKIIERDGHPLTPQAQKEDEQKMDAFVHDAELREKQKRRHEQDAEKANSLTKLLPDAFLWTFAKRDSKETTLRFEPDPQFRPPTREARVFAAMAGVMVGPGERTFTRIPVPLRSSAQLRTRLRIAALLAETRQGDRAFEADYGAAARAGARAGASERRGPVVRPAGARHRRRAPTPPVRSSSPATPRGIRGAPLLRPACPL